MLRWYNAKLAARPLLTQAVTTAALFAIGDVTAQQLVEKKGLKNHEWVRTVRMFGYGGVVFGPCAATWFRILATRVTLPSKNGTILARVAADQLLFAPTFVGIFLGSMAVLEGSDPRDKLSRAYWPALTSNWMLWPAVQMVNFKFVPLQHRLMFVNVVAIGWNCYLSWLNSQSGSEDVIDMVEEIEGKKEE